MSIAIRVESLSKAYRIGLKEELPDTLVAAVTGALTAPLRNWRRLRGLASAGRDLARAERSGALRSGVSQTAASRAGADDLIWALRDVSFDVRPGEVVGVIGQNGAGKSTLLKILSRITEPMRGRAVITGRVSSLLEVGTGFHPELTGRENVYMNGTILGMTKREIDRKFDEIVDFSEVAAFLDTPIKRYSSGMNLRLAFAVAAHLDPEILIVDEVLAVGDQRFQTKCLGKLNDVASSGRTVLFVSHNLAALQTLCQRGLVLRHGRLVEDASIAEAIRTYVAGMEDAASGDLSSRTGRAGSGRSRFNSVEVVNPVNAGAPLALGAPVEFAFRVSDVLPGMSCRFTIFDQYGHGLMKFNSDLHGPTDRSEAGRTDTFTCVLDELLLAPGRYRLDATLASGSGVEDRVEAAAMFDVVSGAVQGRKPPRSQSDWKVFPPHWWILPE